MCKKSVRECEGGAQPGSPKLSVKKITSLTHSRLKEKVKGKVADKRKISWERLFNYISAHRKLDYPKYLGTSCDEGIKKRRSDKLEVIGGQTS